MRSDSGPELIPQKLAAWAEEHNVKKVFIQPGKFAQNTFVERFNRFYREDVLDAFVFSSREEVQAISEEWLEEFNAVRPHYALEGLTPY